MRVLVGLVAAGVALAPAAARAYRPFNGTDADVAAWHEVELELGPVGWLREGSDGLVVVPAGIFNYGLWPRWELVLEGKQFYRPHPSGERRFAVTDTALNLKHVLRDGVLQGGGGASVATEVGVLLPTFHAEPGVGGAATVIVSHAVGPMVAHWNAEGFLSRAHEPGGFAGVIAEPLGWRLRPVSELFVEAERRAGWTASALAGAVFAFADSLSFDAALRVARSVPIAGRAFGEVEARLGLTWSFEIGS